MYNNPLFVGLAEELKDIYDCFHVAGFTEEQAFELTKTLCAYSFEKQAGDIKRAHENDRRSDLRRRLGNSIARQKEDKDNE